MKLSSNNPDVFGIWKGANTQIMCSVTYSVNSSIFKAKIRCSIQMIFEPPRGKTNNVFPHRSDTNRAVLSQKIATDWKFWI